MSQNSWPFPNYDSTYYGCQFFKGDMLYKMMQLSKESNVIAHTNHFWNGFLIEWGIQPQRADSKQQVKKTAAVFRRYVNAVRDFSHSFALILDKTKALYQQKLATDTYLKANTKVSRAIFERAVYIKDESTSSLLLPYINNLESEFIYYICNKFSCSMLKIFLVKAKDKKDYKVISLALLRKEITPEIVEALIKMFALDPDKANLGQVLENTLNAGVVAEENAQVFLNMRALVNSSLLAALVEANYSVELIQDASEKMLPNISSETSSTKHRLL